MVFFFTRQGKKVQLKNGQNLGKGLSLYYKNTP